MEPESSEPGALDYIKNNSDEVLEHVSEYSYLVGDSLVFIAIGMLCVFLLHKLASKLLYPYVSNGRLLGVIFGALYVLVLVVTILLVLKRDRASTLERLARLPSWWCWLWPRYCISLFPFFRSCLFYPGTPSRPMG